MAIQAKLFRVTTKEQRRSLCSICRGHRMLCRKAICPILAKAEALLKLNRELKLECSYLSRLERIERIAREELNMIEPREEQVIIVHKEALDNTNLPNIEKDLKESKGKLTKDDR